MPRDLPIGNDRFLVNFAKDNELRVREGRIEERSRLAELQRVGDTA